MSFVASAFFLYLTLCSAVPGDHLDLSKFELQTPIPDGNGGQVTIKQPELLTYESENFYTDPVDQVTTLWTPVTGATTGGSSNPRTELRERLPTGDWTFSGTHELQVSLRVIQVPSNGKIAIGQIKGKSWEGHEAEYTNNGQIVEEIFWDNGVIVSHARTGNGVDGYVTTTYAVGYYALGDVVTFSLRIDGHVLSTRTDRGGRPAHDYSSIYYGTGYRMYFKAGCYLGDHEGPETEGGIVKILSISTRHLDEVDPVPPPPLPPTTPDPTCELGIKNGEACCPAFCGSCGGSGCGSRPGGSGSCCLAPVKAAGSCDAKAAPCLIVVPTGDTVTPDPNCERGIQAGTACCAASCGECGGSGCSGRPGGGESCCGSPVRAAESCITRGPPCSLETPPVVEEPAPSPADVDCVGGWGDFKACSTTCGAGSQIRTFTITTSVSGTGVPCMEAAGQTESQECNTGVTCPVAEADPFCDRGIKKRARCCAASCGTCGGSGCSSRDGGWAACCTSGVETQGSCSDGPAPCMITEPTALVGEALHHTVDLFHRGSGNRAGIVAIVVGATMVIVATVVAVVRRRNQLLHATEPVYEAL
eukprot:TRINITY_DN10460_c0_g2_i1.p1 TRINITY_DN10460_c0_g2~~TRINITY_DN10460_c0_g2_i1.p1  ORF type:complete len:588 (+),score=120.52 TRINITY_DN10460_c0_g2_i1:57-1820(+)